MSAKKALKDNVFINSFKSLGSEFCSETQIEPFENPLFIHSNQELVKDIDFGGYSDQNLTKIFSGNKSIKGSEVISTVYSGHQFGEYVAQLGDGRAHMVGEILTENKDSYEVQIKGSGKTPYSRFGDGKAVLRSSIREYLIAEAMYNLGVPTTRSLCIIGSDENVMREGMEKAAMVTRLSQSFIRFGHFEYFTHSEQPELTKKLVDYTISKFFFEVADDDKKYEKFFYRVVKKTALLIAKWQSLGFVHGVMNTDNMSILGLTIDYGPFGFMDNFNPNYISNSSDYSGRYSYQNQPAIAFWNLQALAYALVPVLPLEKSREVLSLFKNLFQSEYFDLMRKKIGFKEPRKKDEKLITDILMILENQQVDYTIFFRKLSDFHIDSQNEEIAELFKKESYFQDWSEKYKTRLINEGWSERNKDQENFEKNRIRRMKKANPKYILRNYMLENAISQATYAKDYSEIGKLFNLVKKPFDEQLNNENYSALPPEWSKSINISCSS